MHKTFAILGLFAIGCGPLPCSVSGTVTYDGQPLKDGWITFTPIDGKGQPAGEKIVAGRYSIASLTPGPKSVLVTSTLGAEFPQHTADLEAAAAKAKAAGQPYRAHPVDVLPAAALGNNQTVTLVPGPRTLDIELKSK